MRTFWKCLAFTSVLALAGCDEEEGSERFSESREYRRQLFETPEECEAAQPPGGFFNCYQSVGFEPDGSVVLILTDIATPGTYEIRGDDEVVLRFEPAQAIETGERFTFEIGDDDATVLIDEEGNDWHLVTFEPGA